MTTTEIKEQLKMLSVTGYATKTILDAIKELTDILNRKTPKSLYLFYKFHMGLSYAANFDLKEVKEDAKKAIKLLK